MLRWVKEREGKAKPVKLTSKHVVLSVWHQQFVVDMLELFSVDGLSVQLPEASPSNAQRMDTLLFTKK